MQDRILGMLVRYRALDEYTLANYAGITHQEAVAHLAALKEQNLVELVPGLTSYRATREGKEFVLDREEEKLAALKRRWENE